MGDPKQQSNKPVEIPKNEPLDDYIRELDLKLTEMMTSMAKAFGGENMSEDNNKEDNTQETEEKNINNNGGDTSGGGATDKPGPIFSLFKSNNSPSLAAPRSSSTVSGCNSSSVGVSWA